MNATGRVHGSLVPNFQKVTNAPPRAQCSSPAFLYMYTCTRLQTHLTNDLSVMCMARGNLHGQGEFAWPGLQHGEKYINRCHSLTYVKSRSHSDPKVNVCLDSALAREQEWSRKKSTLVKCDDLWQKFKVKGLSGHQLKGETKKELRNECSQEWSSHIQTLVVQGKFLDLVKSESKCTVWKSLVYNLPHKVAKFLMNSVTDTLNTNANLCRWGKKISDKCKHCGNKETLHHVLNSCQTALQGGRFTWRHDNLLHYLIDLIHEGIKHTEAQIFGDLDNTPFAKIGISTIPNECTQTNLRPDICVLWFSTTRKCLDACINC